MISRRSIVQMMSCIFFNLNILNFKIAWFPRTGWIYPSLNCYSCPFSIGACPFGMLQKSSIEVREDVSSFGILKTLSLLPFFLIGTILVYGIVLGRTICGWACPFGFAQDMLGKFSSKDRMPEKLDRKLRILKYIILIASLIVAAVLLDTFFCKLCPSATLLAAVPYRILFGKGITTIWYIARIIIFAGLMLGLLFLARRFWCRYLCPVGAFLALFSKISLVKVKIKKELCAHCGLCSRVCPMGVKVHEEYVAKGKAHIDSRECIRCGTCIKNCPRKVLSFSWRE